MMRQHLQRSSILLILFVAACARVPMFARALTYEGGVPLAEAVGAMDVELIEHYLTGQGVPAETLRQTRVVLNSPIFDTWPPRGFTWQHTVHLHAVVATLPRCERLGIMVHELIHRWQWDKGDLTAARYAGEALGQLMNHQDTNHFEREAYAVQDAFTASCGR